MKTYDVTIKATVIKTIKVDAATEEEAVEQAHCEFTTANDSNAERYEENMLSVVEVEPEVEEVPATIHHDARDTPGFSPGR